MAINTRQRFLILVFAVVAGWAVTADCAPVPYRFLRVTGNQWKDPASRLIEAGGEFPVVVTLLKTWGLPFDILRLDQQRFDRYYLMDHEGRSRYGTIIWDADADVGEPKDLALLSETAETLQDLGPGLLENLPGLVLILHQPAKCHFDSPNGLSAELRRLLLARIWVIYGPFGLARDLLPHSVKVRMMKQCESQVVLWLKGGKFYGTGTLEQKKSKRIGDPAGRDGRLVRQFLPRAGSAVGPLRTAGLAGHRYRGEG